LLAIAAGLPLKLSAAASSAYFLISAIANLAGNALILFLKASVLVTTVLATSFVTKSLIVFSSPFIALSYFSFHDIPRISFTASPS
jgi:hypothetical protein